jgi:hypothetical protein
VVKKAFANTANSGLEGTPPGTTTFKTQSNNGGVEFHTSLERIRRLPSLGEIIWGIRSQLREQSNVHRCKQHANAASDTQFVHLVQPTVSRSGQENRSTFKLALAEEAETHPEAEEREVNEVGIASWSHAHRTPAGLTSPQILSPTLPLSETTSPPSIYGTATGVSPLQSHDGPASQLNHPPPASPPIRSAYDIELNDLSSREAERPPPPEENGDDTRAQQVGERRHKGFFPPWLCGLAVFLAPVNIVSGMTASHGDNWKLAFVGLENHICRFDQ